MALQHQKNALKIFRILYSSFYFSILGYLVFFARRRGSHHFNYEVNFVPVKNTVGTFFSMNMNDKVEVFNFFANLFGNILLFVPFSIILLRVFKIKNLKFIILWATLLSVFIESNQYLFQVGYADIDDIILNVLGAILGFFVYKIFLRLGFLSLFSRGARLS